MPEDKTFEFTDDVLIFEGGAVKDLGDGKIGGYAIMYSKSIDPDLTKEFFSKDESMIDGPHENSPIFYVHGRDTKMGKRIIGRAVSAHADDIGVWVETQLQTRDEYEKAILAMAKAGKLGYSTGALSHMVDYEPRGDGVQLIKTWVVGEVSLTPTPAEPRLYVQSLKSLTPVEMAALPNETEAPIQTNKEISNMAEIDIKAEVAAALKQELDTRDAAAKAEAEKAAALKTSEEAGYKKAIDELTAKHMIKGAPSVVKDLSSDPDGVQAFKSWLQTGQINHSLIEPDASWTKNEKTAFAIGAGNTGGFLVPDPLYNGIIAKRDLSSWVRQAPVQKFATSSDHIQVPVEHTKAANWTLTAEAAAYTENEPTLDQIDIILYKYTKNILMSEEFLLDQSANAEQWISDVIARSVATTENNIFTLGSGAGNPQGVLTGATAGTTAGSSLTAVAALDLTYLVGAIPAGYNVPAECGFLMRNVTKWITKSLASLPFPFMNDAEVPDFLGYKCYTSDDLPVIGTGSAVGAIIFGNFNYFGVAEKPGILVQRNPYLHMGTGQVDIFCNIYRGSAVLLTEAIIASLNHA